MEVVGKERGVNLTTISILLLLGGAISIFNAFLFHKEIMYFLSFLLIGSLSVVAAYGIWKLRFWGFVLAVTLYTVSIILGIIKRNYIGIIISLIILLVLIREKRRFSRQSLS